MYKHELQALKYKIEKIYKSNETEFQRKTAIIEFIDNMFDTLIIPRVDTNNTDYNFLFPDPLDNDTKEPPEKIIEFRVAARFGFLELMSWMKDQYEDNEKAKRKYKSLFIKRCIEYFIESISYRKTEFLNKTKDKIKEALMLTIPKINKIHNCSLIENNLESFINEEADDFVVSIDKNICFGSKSERKDFLSLRNKIYNKGESTIFITAPVSLLELTEII